MAKYVVEVLANYLAAENYNTRSAALIRGGLTKG